MEHSQALAILLAYAARPLDPPPTSAPAPLDAALAHAATCPECAAAATTLLAALRLGAEDRLSCAESEGLLAEYLAAHTMGHGGDPRWDDLRAHLAGCRACSEALADLAELQGFADGALGHAPPAYPARRPGAAPAPAPAWRIDALGRLLVDLARVLIPPAPALAGLKAAPGQATLAEASLSAGLPDLALHIAVKGRPGEARRVLIVTVAIPSRGGWPNLGGSEVLLLSGGAEVARATTDAFGTAAFPDLDAGTLARYSLEVRPAAPEAQP